MNTHIRTLPDKDLAFIGDVHGEADALRRLLPRISGYHLVFVGDLGDRGPDSPAVFRIVMEQVAAGRASVIVGNHEVSLLRGAAGRAGLKDYQVWIDPNPRTVWTPKGFDEAPPMASVASAAEADEIIRFLARQPVVLERDDVRAVHAGWDSARIAELRASARSLVDLYEDGPAGPGKAPERMRNLGAGPPSSDERDPDWEARSLAAQNETALRVAISGTERIAGADEALRFAGRWRALVRAAWWDDYDEDAHVVIGHYSRSPTGRVKAPFASGGDPYGPLGPRGRVWCVDLAVGRRYEHRAGRPDSEPGRLAALVWRDGGAVREWVFDDGERVVIEGPVAN